MLGLCAFATISIEYFVAALLEGFPPSARERKIINSWPYFCSHKNLPTVQWRQNGKIILAEAVGIAWIVPSFKILTSSLIERRI